MDLICRNVGLYHMRCVAQLVWCLGGIFRQQRVQSLGPQQFGALKLPHTKGPGRGPTLKKFV